MRGVGWGTNRVQAERGGWNRIAQFHMFSIDVHRGREMAGRVFGRLTLLERIEALHSAILFRGDLCMRMNL